MSKYYTVTLTYTMTTGADSEEEAIEQVVYEAKSASQYDFDTDVQEYEDDN